MYLILFGAYTVHLLPCRVQALLEGNVFLSHIIGLFTMLFFVVIAGEDLADENLGWTFTTALVLYILFVLSSKMNIYLWIISFFLLICFYIIVLYEKQDGKLIIKSNPSQNAQDSQQNKIKKPLSIFGIDIDTIKTTLGFIILGSILLGFIIYFGEKRIEYGKNFRFDYFLLGKPTCRGYTQNTPVLESLQKAFYIK
jgi:hypothetical protein